ncbi:MAG: ribonuclease HI [Ignavibacteriae bacterium]|nr:ribonuclease HI [Ignavibacteriota bacterium]
MLSHTAKKTKNTTKSDRIIIYCDGACSGNQFLNNKGGWGVVLKYKDKIKEIYGGELNTSNQRMELTACIKAIEQLKRKDLPIEIYSDSAYLVNCIQQQWYKKWQKNGWKNVNKKAVENKDLWQRLVTLLEKYPPRRVSFHKVTGHQGIQLNERADTLARLGIEELS